MRIVVLVGLPGSGKSTWLAQAGGGGISSDAVRKLLADDETELTVRLDRSGARLHSVGV